MSLKFIIASPETIFAINSYKKICLCLHCLLSISMQRTLGVATKGFA